MSQFQFSILKKYLMKKAKRLGIKSGIEQMVNELYGLTEEEIIIVEHSIKLK